MHIQARIPFQSDPVVLLERRLDVLRFYSLIPLANGACTIRNPVSAVAGIHQNRLKPWILGVEAF
jgi:hypothetical protein